MAVSQRIRVQRHPVHGVLLLDKPIGLSSNQALQKAKWLLRAEKAGHTGTLDPLATGVLPLCFGAATKFSQIHLDADKTYEATLRLGQTTETGDAEGALLQERIVRTDTLAIDAVLQRFLGPQQQIPPMYCALKKDGKALYEYARRGITVERTPRHINVFSLMRVAVPEALSMQYPPGALLKIRVAVSKGTYIRTLAQDIGEALGCGAHLISLRRVQTGAFSIQECTTLESLEQMKEAQRLNVLRPVDALLTGFTRVALDHENAGRFLTGMRRHTILPDCEKVAVYGPMPTQPSVIHPPCAKLQSQETCNGVLLGTARISAGSLIPLRLLSPVEIAQAINQIYDTAPA